MSVRLAIDIGGTFTDATLIDEETGGVAIAKVLTTPSDPSEGFMQAVNDRLMGATGPDPFLRIYIEQNYLPSLRLEKKTIRGYRDTWNLHWKSRIQDLTFAQLHPDIAFRMLKEIADEDDLSKSSLQRVRRSCLAYTRTPERKALFVERIR